MIKDFFKSQRQLIALSLQFFNVKHFLKNIKTSKHKIFSILMQVT